MEQAAFATPSQIAAHQRRKAFRSGLTEIAEQRRSIGSQRTIISQETELLREEQFILSQEVASLRSLVNDAKVEVALTQTEIDRLAAKLIEHQLASQEIANSARLSVQMVARRVARYYEVSMADLLSPRRHAVVVLPRQVAMYLAKELTRRSLPDIGRRFGGRDHTTVLHAIRKITRLRPIDAKLDADIRALLVILQPQEASNAS